MNAPSILLNIYTYIASNRVIDASELEFRDCILPFSDLRQVLLASSYVTEADRYILEQYALWANYQSGYPIIPQLTGFRDYLLTKGRNPSTISNYMSSIRKRYDELSRNREYLFSLVRKDVAWTTQHMVVNELVERIRNATHPKVGRVRYETVQDVPDSKHLRLTHEQVDALLHAPGTAFLRGLRDTAMIAVALCTGTREAELINLDVADLRQHLQGEQALQIRNGKGKKTRLVPYGALDWCLSIVDAWLQASGISSGPVFRSVTWYATKKDHKVTPNAGALHPRTFNDILDRYPILVNGAKVQIRPHDLRRTYALRCYEAGMDIVRIQRNMGHVNSATTSQYIGPLDGHIRRPPAAYNLPADLLSTL